MACAGMSRDKWEESGLPFPEPGDEPPNGEDTLPVQDLIAERKRYERQRQDPDMRLGAAWHRMMQRGEREAGGGGDEGLPLTVQEAMRLEHTLRTLWHEPFQRYRPGRGLENQEVHRALVEHPVCGDEVCALCAGLPGETFSSSREQGLDPYVWRSSVPPERWHVARNCPFLEMIFYGYWQGGEDPFVEEEIIRQWCHGCAMMRESGGPTSSWDAACLFHFMMTLLGGEVDISCPHALLLGRAAVLWEATQERPEPQKRLETLMEMDLEALTYAEEPRLVQDALRFWESFPRRFAGLSDHLDALRSLSW